MDKREIIQQAHNMGRMSRYSADRLLAVNHFGKSAEPPKPKKVCYVINGKKYFTYMEVKSP